MITISEAHYLKLVSTVELLHKNSGFLFPNQGNLQIIYEQWKEINRSLTSLYGKIRSDMESIESRNTALEAENKELKQKIEHLTLKSEELLKINTMQRAELAKNSAECNRLKEMAKSMKASLKEKDEAIKQSTSMLEQLSGKGKKYKKLYQDQVKKVEKLDQMVAVLQVTQRSSAKQKELDQEMQELQAELQNISKGDDLRE